MFQGHEDVIYDLIFFFGLIISWIGIILLAITKTPDNPNDFIRLMIFMGSIISLGCGIMLYELKHGES